MKTKTFKSYNEYEAWAENFENGAEYEEIPTYIEDGDRISADMIVECKKATTAVKKFVKQFEKFALVKEWAMDSMMECVNDGTFKDTYSDDGNMYSWEIEEIDEGIFYIYIVLKGVYAIA